MLVGMLFVVPQDLLTDLTGPQCTLGHRPSCHHTCARGHRGEC